MTTPTPRAILDAGNKERERWKVFRSVHGCCVMGLGRPVVFGDWDKTDEECQDFIDDRVFRAQLRAMAESEHVPLVKQTFLILAGDDHARD